METTEEFCLLTCTQKENTPKEFTSTDPNTGRWIDTLLRENDLDDTSYYPYMNGSFVFKHAVTRFPEAIMEALNKNNLTPADINMLHFASSQFAHCPICAKNNAFE